MAKPVTAAPLPAPAPPVPADRRAVAAEERRIAACAIDHLCAMVGVSRVEGLGDAMIRTLTPTGNRLAAALRDAGYDLGAAGRP